MEQIVIWWLKKDFRLEDNPALTWSLENGTQVVPVFILEPSAINAPETSRRHVDSWLSALRELRSRLRKNSGELCVLTGEVLPELQKLRAVLPFHKIVSHEEVGIERTFARDRAVKKWAREEGVEWIELRQTGVFRGLKDRDLRASYWKEWMGQGPLATPSANALQKISVPKQVMDLRAAENRRLTGSGEKGFQPVTESAAQKTLETFLHQRGLNYSSGISSPNTAFHSGSRLSVHLAWGTITGRNVYDAVQKRVLELKESDDPDAGKWRRSLSSFLARLNWRDHFIQRLESEPQMEFHSLNEAYDDLPFVTDEDVVNAWKMGETGLPLVDAVIRCAQQTGFMNFRMRCMITSVGCHALQMDWRDIDHAMARWWTDYEPGIHLSQLQMQAGVVGINTLRTYNPAKQISDHDPTARFVKRWVPELKPYTVEEIIAHQTEPLKGYLRPIIDWKAGTSEMRSNYYAIKRTDRAKALAEIVFENHGSRKGPTRRPKKKAAGAKA